MQTTFWGVNNDSDMSKQSLKTTFD